MTIAKGAAVRQKVFVIEGAVEDRRFNDSSDEMEYHVSYVDDKGEPHSRWFKESELTIKENAQ